MSRRMCRLIMAVAFAVINAGFARASSHDFYRDKTVRFVVGMAPGGAVDAYARLIVRQMSEYAPGNPTIIVQNMAGAGSLVAANYVYGAARPDGLKVGTEAKKARLDVDPTSGEELQKIVENLLNIRPAPLPKLKELLNNGIQFCRAMLTVR